MAYEEKLPDVVSTRVTSELSQFITENAKKDGLQKSEFIRYLLLLGAKAAGFDGKIKFCF
jgi:hypothetical protein